ncbi:MAG: isochorismate synthase [Polyangiaceae bacterium]
MLAWAKKNIATEGKPATGLASRLTSEDRFVVLTTRVSPDRLAHWTERAIATKHGFLWAPGDLAKAHDAWTLAGHGATTSVEACGADRFAHLREEARRQFSSTVEWAERDVLAPRLRFFGGAAFHAELVDPLWTGFGDASFVLPRWLYGVKNGEAFLRFAFRREELAAPELLLAEIERVESDVSSDTANESAGSSSPPAADEDATWRPLVESALAAITSGAFHKLVVARRTSVTRSISVSRSLRRLRRENSESTTFAFVRGLSAFFGASPERLIFLEGNRFFTEALAGTIARELDDDAAKKALLASDKDRREHRVVVDGIAAALIPFSNAIEIAAAPAIRTLGRVHHLATPITGQVDRNTHVLDLVAALHPTPAVSGLPQRAASEWIRDHESFERGWYAAPVGWFDDRGDGTFAVAIRSALVSQNRAWVFAGAGIVNGSEPDAELRETQLKQKTILAALSEGVAP